MFKNKKIKTPNLNKPKKNSSFFGIIVSFLALILLFIVWKNIITNIQVIIPSIDLSFNNQNSFIAPTTINWKLNIMLIWKWGLNHEWADLTDTIILSSIDQKKGTVSMFSIPRDLYVEFENWGEGKINDIYFNAVKRWKTHEDAMGELERKVTEITWEKVWYYVMVDFKGFVDIVNAIWWIEVDVPDKIVDTSYPDWNFWYKTFRIEKWLQTLDWETALKYARSRKTTSDFDRSIRQQLILRAVKEKIENLGFLKSPSKIKWLYLGLKNNIETDFSLAEIVSLWLYAKDLDQSKINTFNLNDSCYYGSDKCEKWGFMYYPLRSDFKNLSVSLPYWADRQNLSNYDLVQRYTNLIFNYPEIYNENLKINVFNWTKTWGLAWDRADKLKRYWFNIPDENSIWNARDKEYPNSVIYYNGIETDNKTLEALSLFIFWWEIKVEQAKFSTDPDVRIEVVIWDDYNSLEF